MSQERCKREAVQPRLKDAQRPEAWDSARWAQALKGQRRLHRPFSIKPAYGAPNTKGTPGSAGVPPSFFAAETAALPGVP
ncbi:MAG: hypothetical protein QUT30_08910, partial [Acidobacteriota bacterium]|nr:hypothetical protein [Acidobacteriota bacterium]